MGRYGWLIIGAAFGVLSFLVTPAGLASFGIMDMSLASEVALTRQTALLEVQLVRGMVFILGLSVIIGAALWPSIAAHPGFIRFLATDLRFPAAYELALRRGGQAAFWLICGLIILALAYLKYGGDIFSPLQLQNINREDGWLENIATLVLAMAALLAVWVGAQKGLSGRVRIWHGILAVLFFVMCGEELSWGQRVFGFETPQSLRGLNVQNELNLHNMYGHFFDHAFVLCFFIWGCVLPCLYALSTVARQLLRAVSLPIPSIGLAGAMLLISLFQDQLVMRFVPNTTGVRPVELREFMSMIAFFLLMLQSWSGMVWRRSLPGQPGSDVS